MIWRSEDVVACNDFSGLRDLYCRMWMETDSKKKRDTDTHWRCKKGKARKGCGEGAHAGVPCNRRRMSVYDGQEQSNSMGHHIMSAGFFQQETEQKLGRGRAAQALPVAF